jgi:hypothetical protein
MDGARHIRQSRAVVRRMARWLQDEQANACGTGGSGGSMTELP